MMNMKLLQVVTPLSIYHSCSTRKKFLEEKYTGEETLFSLVSMKNCGCHNVRKYKEIRGCDKYVTLDISIKFENLDKTKITSSESKIKLEISGMGLITSLGFKAKVRMQKYKKARYAIINVSKKDLSKIIWEFEKFENLPYEKKRPKNDPTDCYFYLANQIEKCMMRSDTLNRHNCGGYTEMNSQSLNVDYIDEDESKRIIVHETLSQKFSVNKADSKQIIVHKTLS